MPFKIFRAKSPSKNQPNKPLTQEVSSQPPSTLKKFQRGISGGFLGFLGMIALPALLCPGDMSSAANRSAGRTYASYLNRAQQGFYLEHGNFANQLEDLGSEIRDSGVSSYRYLVETKGNLVFNTVVVKENDSDSRSKRFSYISAVAVLPRSSVSGGNESSQTKVGAMEMTTILCASKQAGPLVPPEPKLLDRKLTCSKGTVQVQS